MHHLLLSIAAFAASAFVFTVAPGLDTVTTLRTATAYGHRAGLATVLGICGGLGLWGIGAAFGLTALLAASATAFTLVKWAGAAYLAWLGIRLLLYPRSTLAQTASSEQPSQASGRVWENFRCGLLTNLLNPKVGIFFITFFPQFIPQHVNVSEFSLLLAAIQMLISMLWLGLLVLLTVPLARFLSSPVIVRRLDRLSGCIFIAFGVKLLLTERH